MFRPIRYAADCDELQILQDVFTEQINPMKTLENVIGAGGADENSHELAAAALQSMEQHRDELAILERLATKIRGQVGQYTLLNYAVF